MPSPAPGRRRCAPPAARSRWSTRCSATAPCRLLRAPAARPPRRGRRARWASASSTTSPSPRRTRCDAHGAERVLILDWDVHHGNGTNDDLPRATRASCSCSIHQSPLYPGTGPAADVGLGRRGRATRSTCRCRAGSGDAALRARWSSTSSAPLITAWQPRLVLVSAGFDAHSRDPLASCRVTEAGFAAMTASLRRACDAGRARRSGSCSRAATTSARWRDSVCALHAGAGGGRPRRPRRRSSATRSPWPRSSGAAVVAGALIRRISGARSRRRWVGSEGAATTA